MATITYTYNDAWQVARPQYDRSVEPVALEYATNRAVNLMWQAYDWRGTTAPLPPFWIVPYTQDYGTPFYVVPSDFLGLREIYLTQVSTSTGDQTPMKVLRNLDVTAMSGMPQSICYRPDVRALRIHPMPPGGYVAPNWLIEGTYKIRPPKITRSTLGNLILWDDIYFGVFAECCAWAALACSGKREAAMQQLGVVHELLRETTGTESLELGAPSLAPSEGFGIIRPSGWNSF